MIGNASLRMMSDCLQCDVTPPQVRGAVEQSTERLAFATAAGTPPDNAPPVLLLDVFSDCNSFARVATKRGHAQVPALGTTAGIYANGIISGRCCD